MWHLECDEIDMIHHKVVDNQYKCNNKPAVTNEVSD